MVVVVVMVCSRTRCVEACVHEFAYVWLCVFVCLCVRVFVRAFLIRVCALHWLWRLMDCLWVVVPFRRKKWKSWHRGNKQDVEAVRAALTNCVYLQNSSVTIDGVTIYGCPIQPAIPGRTMAFNILDESTRADIYAQVPANVDVLVTHAPPFGNVSALLAVVFVRNSNTVADVDAYLQID